MRIPAQNLIFSLLYTSCRPDSIAPALEAWLGTVSAKDSVESVMTHDMGDTATREAMLSAQAQWESKGFRVVVGEQSDLPGDCVKGWNSAATIASGKVLISISDDFVAFQNWDVALLGCAPNGWTDADCCVLVSDGCLNSQTLMATLGIITTKRYKRFGYLWYPGYQSMFSDNELAERAVMDRALIDARHLTFRHNHWVMKSREQDVVDQVHSSPARHERGRILFEMRRRRGFPIDRGPAAVQYTPQVGFSASHLVAYIQAIRDDFCLQAVCDRLFEEGVQSFFFSIPDAYWDGTPQPQEQLDEVIEVARIMEAKGCYVAECRAQVETYRPGTSSRIEVETNVRNAMLRMISDLGWGHILIVDSDELWRRGLVASVVKMIKRDRPPYIACRSVPVIGCPGYPVDDATDRVGIYIRGDNRLTFCRAGFSNLGHEIDGFPVIHFSATRKTPEELVAKMRASGHYDDSAYDFEGWIRDVLPDIRAGVKGVHMYHVKGQPNIWPEVRLWTPAEFEDIPLTVRPFVSCETKDAPLPRLAPLGVSIADPLFREVAETAAV